MRVCVVGAALGLAVASSVSAGVVQDPMKMLPNNYRLAFKNDDVRVIRAHYGAHERIPVHDHAAFATVFVYLSDFGQVRIAHAEAGEQTVSVVRPPTVKGAYRVAESAAERHSTENLGDASSDFLRVELKHAPLQLKEPFRGKAPEDFSHNSDMVEFRASGVTIERVVCTALTSCEVDSAAAGSLLIALAPLTITGAKSILSVGDVRWMPSSNILTVSSGSGEPVHLLRILLPEISSE